MRIAGIDVVIKLERLPESMSVEAPESAAKSSNP
jgi:hypothetical protein